jgi:hypothetical protein
MDEVRALLGGGDAAGEEAHGQLILTAVEEKGEK